MNNGKTFETTVRIIQEALKKNTFTTIKQNYKLRDNLDLVREFDVFIESKMQGFDVKIAIECKDYKSKVSIEKIEAFQSKCNDVAEINKKIFVSRTGFQSGAIKKAKFYGIDLYLLERFNEQQVLNWFKFITPIRIERELSNISVRFIENSFNYELSDTLLLENGKIEITLNEFIRKFEENNLVKPKLFIYKDNPPLPRIETINLIISLPGSFLMNKVKKSEISEIGITIRHIFKKKDANISYNSFRTIDNLDNSVQSMTVVTESQDLFSFVSIEGNDIIDIMTKVLVDNKEEFIKLASIKTGNETE